MYKQRTFRASAVLVSLLEKAAVDWDFRILRLLPMSDNCMTSEFDPLLTSGSKPPSSRAFLVDDLCS